jgi:hypothetical protein
LLQIIYWRGDDATTRSEVVILQDSSAVFNLVVKIVLIVAV